jgi:hypothetical protein
MERVRQSALEKVPGTAELIDFVQVVRARRIEQPTEPWKDRFKSCIHALAKTEHDFAVIDDILKSETSLAPESHSPARA